MKLNKKLIVVNVLATLLFSEAVMAAPKVIKATNSGKDTSTGSGSSTPIISSGTKTTVIVEQKSEKFIPAEIESCKGGIGHSKFFPQQLVNMLIRNEDKMTIEKNSDGLIDVKIPPIVDVCGRFVPDVRSDDKTKNVTVLMTVIGDRVEKETVDGKENVKITKNVELTYKEFEDCLIEKKIMVDGSIDHNKISTNDYSSYLYRAAYAYDKKEDIGKSISLHVGFPDAFKNEGYANVYPEDKVTNKLACISSERVASDTTLLNKGREDYLRDFKADCASGIAQRIADAITSLGNAESLKDIADKLRAELDAGYLVAVRKDVDKINVILGKIEEKLKDPKDMNEKRAKELMKEYTENLKKIDTLFTDKAILRIKELLAEREKLEEEKDADAIEAIDKEIKTLNSQIAEFSKRSGLNAVYLAVEHFNLRSYAEIVEDLYLKSKNYSLVYEGKADERGKALTLEEAQKNRVEGMKRFKPVLAEWDETYQVRNGNQAPVIKVQREIQTAVARKNSRLASFRKKEMEDYNSYCTAGMLGQMKNKTKCTEFFQGKDRRERAQLKRYEKDSKFIMQKERKFSKFSGAYMEYDFKRNAEREKDDDGRWEGSSYSGYEDSFDERFPSYSGSSQPGFVDSNMFNMMGMGQQQMFPQQQQMFPQQQMMGQQQMMMPQFQQPNMGQWPGMQ